MKNKILLPVLGGAAVSVLVGAFAYSYFNRPEQQGNKEMPKKKHSNIRKSKHKKQYDHAGY
ncbi:MAG: hypothetical protein H7Y03_02340 [Chitinophagaceae bacterium]|nr:hypothetical protein [Chitinophagaceae bacterium]